MKKLVQSILFLALVLPAFAQPTPGGSLGIAVDPSGNLAFLQVNSLGQILVAGSGRGLAAITPGGETGVALDPSNNFAFLHVDSGGGLILSGGGGGGSPGGSYNSVQINSSGSFGGIGPVNSAVVVTNSSGVASESTTLPSGLTIPGYAPVAGDSSIVTVGTIGTGVWQGTAVAAGYGGTGQSTYTKGDILVGGTNTLNKLGVGADGYVVTADSSQTYGVKWAAGGSGTVTHTAGALTPYHIMMGNGGADSYIDSAITTDGAGTLTGIVALTVGSFTVTGTSTFNSGFVVANGQAITGDTTNAHTWDMGYYYTTGTAYENFLVATNGSTPSVTFGPTTHGTAALGNGVTAATQAIGDTSTDVATDAFAQSVVTISAAPASGVGQGIKVTYLNAGGSSLSLGEAVTYNSSGNWVAADCTTPTVARGVVVSNAGGASTPAVVLTNGVLTKSGWSWTVGGIIYLSTAGGLTQTAPSGSGNIIQQVGTALSATTVLFNFTNEYVTHS
jgi:hypothetical protein